MERNEFRAYLTSGVTGFLVVAASIPLFFVIYHGQTLWQFYQRKAAGLPDHRDYCADLLQYFYVPLP